ncbi:MAG: hypothetical protein IJL59_08820, partial [Clostridia bacterium]|nr:hypothetical protein [Clostridia bacterium]
KQKRELLTCVPDENLPRDQINKIRFYADLVFIKLPILSAFLRLYPFQMSSLCNQQFQPCNKGLDLHMKAFFPAKQLHH